MPPRGRATTTSVNLLPSDFVGQRVELQGLTARADLNGQVGVAKSYDSARGRLAVALDSGEGAAMSDGFWGSGPPLLVRPAHLRLVELETGAVTAAASDEMLRAKRYVEAAIERAGGGGREARRLRRLLASLFQRQLHCVRMAAAEHASVLSECASRAEVPPALWDALSERQQQARAASAHCDASYRALLSDAIEARDAACWSRSAALGCAFLAAEPDRAAEARQLAGKLVRLHGCPGSRPCHDARVALAVAAAGGAGPVAEQPEVCAPVCAALRAEVWERMVAAEPLRRELLEPGESSSSATVGAIDAFNAAMKDVGLQLRHQIAKNTSDGSIYAAALGGVDAQRLCADLQKIEDGPGGWRSSAFFTALHAALVALGCTQALARLDALAATALEFADAVHLMRLGPKEMMAYEGGPEQVYRDFEAASAAYCTRWVGVHNCQFKGYGFHLWASLPLLFRKYGCLELINQNPIEATMEQIGKRVQRIQFSDTAGAYSMEAQADPAKQQEELEARRRRARSPAQLMYEEFSDDKMDLSYQPIPHGKKEKGPSSRITAHEIMLQIDLGIADGKVISYEQYCQYWTRWMAVQRVLLKGRWYKYRMDHDANARAAMVSKSDWGARYSDDSMDCE